MSADKPDFTPLTDAEIKTTMDQGQDRTWVAGRGQTVIWANCVGVRLYRRKDGRWVGVENLQNSMHGLLLQDVAIQFAGGKVVES